MGLSIEDRFEIADLYSKWCITIDDGDAQGWVDLFTQDGVFTLVAPPVRKQGRAELMELAEMVYKFDQGMNRHLCHNIVIEGDRDEATGRCDAEILELRTGGDARIIKTARYHDRFVRLDGRWRIAEREIVWDTPHIPEQPVAEGFELLNAE